MSAFEELGVMPEIIHSLEGMDWQLPTPVQTEAIPLILGGGDVAVAAETGAGKTGAFCLPIVQVVYETRNTNLFKRSEAPLKEDALAPIRLSTVDRGKQIAISEDRTVAQCRHPAIWEGARATKGVASGKWYYCATVRDEGLCRVGWSSRYAQLNLGTDRRGFGFGGTSMKSHGGKFDPYGDIFGKGDTLCCMIEFSPNADVHQATVEVSFLKNDLELGSAFSTPWDELGVENLSLFPAVALKNAEIEVDFSVRSAKAESLGFRSMSDVSPDDGDVSHEFLELLSRQDQDGDVEMQLGQKGEKGKLPVALILEPSRELAGQVEEELKKFSAHLPAKSVRHLLLTGGGNPKTEKSALRSGTDIVSGTLGSIVSHVKRGNLNLDSIRFFVLDEADTFATDSFSDVSFLHQKVPSRNNVQTLMFSATLHSKEIQSLSARIQSFPTWVDLKGKESVPDTVHHTMVRLDPDADIGLIDESPKGIEWPLDMVHLEGKTLMGGKAGSQDADMTDASDVRSQLIKKLKLAALLKTVAAHNMSQAMLFVRTQQDADNVESFLLQCSGVDVKDVNNRRFRGRRDTGPEVEYSCSVLHGGRRQQERNEALAAFKAGEVRFLVCTDVAARGIDVVGLPYLVNISLPDKSENYIHRVGRVGRAERLGLAVSLVATQKEAVWYHTCNKAKGGVCKNRKLSSAGGCVIWQNEPKMLAEIEERLKGQIEELGPDFRRRDVELAPRVYGARVGEVEVSLETAIHVEQLQPAVKTLVRMEEEAQASFFALQMQSSFS